MKAYLHRDSVLIEVTIFLAAGVTFLWNASTLGIWEPWEAEAASITRNMLESGALLTVNAGLPSAPQMIGNLPFGWWPQVVSMAIFGESEFSLRLPNVLLCLVILVGLYGLSNRMYGRTIARLTMLFAISIPSFMFQTIFVLGPMLPLAAITLSCIAVLWHCCQVWDHAAMRWLVWMSISAATLTCGIIGFVLPLIVWQIMRQGASPNWSEYGAHKIPLVCALILTITGIIAASLYRPEGLPISQWLWFIDGLAVDRKLGFRPAFSLYVHQVGFGLFPWGVLAPLAFGILAFNRDQSQQMRTFHLSILLWFSGAFVYGAITYSWTQYALFLAAPALALVLGPFFERLYKDPTENGFLILVAILLVALLDSNLKHDPRLLAETFVGVNVETFPAKVWYTRYARILDFALLGTLLLFGSNILTWAKRNSVKLLYPDVAPVWNGFGGIMFSLVLTVGLCAAVYPALQRQLIHLPFGNLMMWVRVALAGILIGSMLHFILQFVWSWRFRVAIEHDRPEIKPMRLEPRWAIICVASICGGWFALQQYAIAATMTDNFSQRGLLQTYEQHKDSLDGAPLYNYDLPEGKKSYYARDLNSIGHTEFSELCRNEKPFFAVIQQKNLAQVNDRYRKASSKTSNAPNHLPVLYDSGARFYLVSNRLPTGAQDLNPMKRAFLKDADALPMGTNRVDINFENKVKIIGWRIEPSIARRGSPLKMIVYWQVLSDRVGTWKIFVHIDAPGQRIHADHEPVAGLLPTRNWRKGDVIADEHTIKVDRTKSPATFTFFTGLFKGNKRLKITEGSQDGKNRAKLGRIRLK